MAPTTKTKLRSSDGRIIEAEVKAVKMFEALRPIWEDEDVNFPNQVKIDKVDSFTLSMVVKYCEKHTSNDDQGVKEWDEEFKGKFDSFPKVFKLINASSYLYVKDLEELAVQKTVEMLTGLTVEEVREAFNLPRDEFTKEEEAKYRERFAWAFE